MAQQGQRVRLHRLNGTPRQPKGINNNIIEKNLEPLKQNNKKMVAQKLYYQNHPEHQSPLTRDKGPVHQRLGVKQMRLRRLVPLGTSTSSVLPRKRLFNNKPMKSQNFGNLNRPGQFKRQKLQRLYSAQARLERIRLQQQNNTSTIKLRRLNSSLPPATNLTVEVNNPNFVPMSSPTAFTYHNHHKKFKMILNPQIQEEIYEIQKDFEDSIGALPPMTRITPATTGILISSRFGLL